MIIWKLDNMSKSIRSIMEIERLDAFKCPFCNSLTWLTSGRNPSVEIVIFGAPPEEAVGISVDSSVLSRSQDCGATEELFVGQSILTVIDGWKNGWMDG